MQKNSPGYKAFYILKKCYLKTTASVTTAPVKANDDSKIINWISGFSDPNARATTASVGDKLTFQWSGDHNVWMFATKAEFDSCDFSKASLVGGNSPVTHTMTQVPAYFACKITGHCAGGQKLAVTAATNPKDAAKVPRSAVVALTLFGIAFSVLLF